MSKIETVVKTPVVETIDEVIKPKTIRLSGFHGDEASAIQAARQELEARRDWIDAVLDAGDDGWEVGVSAKGDVSEVRIVGKGLVAFTPDHQAATASDGVPNEGDAEDAA